MPQVWAVQPQTFTFQSFIMSVVLQESFAKAGALAAFGKLIDRIRKAVASKNITVVKLLKIYPILENAVKQIEAVLSNKEG